MIPMPAELVRTLEGLARQNWTGKVELNMKDGRVLRWEKRDARGKRKRERVESR